MNVFYFLFINHRAIEKSFIFLSHNIIPIYINNLLYKLGIEDYINLLIFYKLKSI